MKTHRNCPFPAVPILLLLSLFSSWPATKTGGQNVIPNGSPAGRTPPLSIGQSLPRVAAVIQAGPASALPRSWTNALILAEEREPRSNVSDLRVRVLSAPGLTDPVRVEEMIERRTNGREVVVSRMEAAAGHVLARTRAGVNNQTLLAALRPSGVVAVHALNNQGLVRLDLAAALPRAVPQALAALQQAGDLVDFAEPDYVVHLARDPDDPAYTSGELWGLRNSGQTGGVNDADIDADEAWETRTDASSVVVAVIDTGIRLTHEDIAPNLWVNPNEVAGDGIDNDGNGVVDDVSGYNAINRTGNPGDDNGHGTHVAGTIGARGNNGLGVAGVAWQARLMAVKFLDANGSGFVSAGVRAIDYAREMGAQVMNNSWGTASYSQSLADAIERTRQAGIIFVAAAGNDGVSTDSSPHYPAAYPHDNIVSVAATTRMDDLASYSNYGQRTVDIAAPGSVIYSCWHTSDSGYQTLNGTSMATPHVTGAMAVLKAQFPGASHRELIERLLATADHPAGLALRVRSQGRLNLARALLATTIVPPPSITEQPQRTNVVAGARVTFSTSVQGGEPLSYQWRRNGFDLPGATSAVLSLTNVAAADAGRYTVLVTNVSGIDLSEEAALVVSQPVTILSQPQGVVLPVDATLVMEVNAAGDQPISFQWRKDDADLPGETSSNFRIHGVTTDDAGTYSVRVSNAVSSTVSDPAVLEVVAGPTIVLQPVDQAIVVGATVTFSVEAEGGGPPGYQWTKDGIAIPGANTATLILTNADAELVGAYSVRVTNVAGQVWSVAAGLTLKNSADAAGFPEFTEDPSDQTANTGATLSFTALATPGDVTYQWRHDGADIPGATAPVLTISNAVPVNAGLYTLVASNSQGLAASRGARLILRQAPVITQQPESVTAVPGTQVVLEVAVSENDETPSYEWRKDGLAVSGATGRRLIIASAGKGDTGTYTVTVSNPAGSVTSSPATVSLTTTAITTWRQIDPGLDMSQQGCASGAPDGIYVAGFDGVFSWSPDGGRSWSRRRPPVGPGRYITGISYALGRYVAIGGDNNTPFSLTSSDGIEWTRHTPALAAPFSQRLHFDGTRFYTINAGYDFASSADGVTWTIDHLNSPHDLYDSCNGTGRYVVVGGRGTIYTSTDHVSWSPAESMTTESLAGVCHGAAGFVAVGGNGAVLTSPDGLAWTVQPTVTSQRLNGVEYGNGRYVAVGGSLITGAFQPAVTLVSEDGANWRRTSNHGTDNLNSVVFANGLFVAVGGNGLVLTSEDGESWSPRQPADRERLYGIATGNNVFVAVGADGIIRNSEDGLTWVTARAGQSENFTSTCFGEGKFVVGVSDGSLYTSGDAVSWRREITGAGWIGCVRYLNGQFFALTDSGEILTSADAGSWIRPPLVTGAPLKHIVWSGSLYVVAGYDGTILTSVDGQNWTLRATPTRLPLLGIAHGAGRFVAVGLNGILLTSSDGNSWTLGDSGQTNALFGITYGNGQFVASGENGTILTSETGESWKPQVSGASSYLFRTEFLNGRYVATGSGYVCHSIDGVTWAVVRPDFLEDVAFGDGKYVGVGSFGWIRVSADLNSWIPGSIGSLTSFALNDVKFQGGQFVACGGGGNIITSTNGQDWTARDSDFANGLEKLAYGAGRHVAVGNGGIILHSADAANWTQADVPNMDQWSGVAFVGGQFIAVGWPGGIATSPDGIAWTKRASPTSGQIQAVAYGNDTYVAAAFFGEILTSPDGINWAVQFNADRGLTSLVFSDGRFVASGQSAGMFTSIDGITWAASERDTSLNLYGLMDYEGAVFGVGDNGVITISAPAPTIIDQPASQQAPIGSPVTLTVTASSPGRLRYQWFKDGQAVPAATSPVLSWSRIDRAQAGTYFVRVTGLGGVTDSIRAVVTVIEKPFGVWQIAHFGVTNVLDPTLEGSLWGALADPDGDDQLNVGEYAFGSNPLVPETESSLQAEVVAGRLRVTFTRRRNDPALQVTPQVSGDLAAWLGGPAQVTEVQVTPLDQEFERVTVEDTGAALSGASRFMRVLINLNED